MEQILKMIQRHRFHSDLRSILSDVMSAGFSYAISLWEFKLTSVELEAKNVYLSVQS